MAFLLMLKKRQMIPEKKTKNLLIKTSEEAIDAFKIKSFNYYKDNKKLKYFSFRHYIVLCLLSIEVVFSQKYESIEIPSEDFLAFYKKRGTKSKIEDVDEVKTLGEMGSINFMLPRVYADLYFTLMHNYYINECGKKTSYSISQFFLFIVKFIEENNIDYKDVNLQ